jgi:hypothetical protein
MPIGTRAKASEAAGGGHYLEVMGVVALESLDKSNPQRGGEVGVFTISFLTSAPARVTENVDVRRPNSEAGVNLADALLSSFVMFGPGFIGDGRGNLMEQLRVPGSGQTDSLGKHRRYPSPAQAMQPFIPPVVLGHIQVLNSRRIKEHLGDFFCQRHFRNQVVNASFEG